MRMNDQEYFRSCVAKERHLAQLLGHRHIEECYESAGTLWDNAQALPQWTRDWRACGPLMTEYGITVTYGHPAGQAGNCFASTQGQYRPNCELCAGTSTNNIDRNRLEVFKQRLAIIP